MNTEAVGTLLIPHFPPQKEENVSTFSQIFYNKEVKCKYALRANNVNNKRNT